MNMLHHLGRVMRTPPIVTSETMRLKVLHAVWEHDPDLVASRLHRQRALARIRAIYECAENGKVAMIESGMDCDCVQYDGRVHLIDATPAAARALSDSIAEWADGPFHLSVERPSVAERIQYRSRDRALEAYEDGHPHSVTYGSMDD